ncbi:microsomal glutathione S-transferase 1-like isoform X2 [Contarinia nasturtii]|uniref:microsomal glutathione S-transferase 1-like isoform X2 n=1 Tax=Contarinia nasturtii TaxID=265458 RepID=UPI0012D4645F|nr:microsomal glutathione S-transferase 1-like isoform X2 [Contarinia nasturtii]
MKTIVELMSPENQVFTTYIAWSCILVIKMLLMAPFTAFFRMKTGTAASPEDMAMMRVTELTTNEEVDRVKRAHLNDMENILPFLSVGLFYVLTDPSAMVAIWLFRVTTVARFVHTFVYAIYVVPQPARAICFFTHFGITFYMAFMSILYFI